MISPILISVVNSIGLSLFIQKILTLLKTRNKKIVFCIYIVLILLEMKLFMLVKTPNLYEKWEINRVEQKETIRMKYMDLMKVHHPDKGTSSSDEFTQIKVFFNFLKIEWKKDLYDRFGHIEPENIRPFGDKLNLIKSQYQTQVVIFYLITFVMSLAFSTEEPFRKNRSSLFVLFAIFASIDFFYSEYGYFIGDYILLQDVYDIVFPKTIFTDRFALNQIILSLTLLLQRGLAFCSDKESLLFVLSQIQEEKSTQRSLEEKTYTFKKHASKIAEFYQKTTQTTMQNKIRNFALKLLNGLLVAIILYSLYIR